eukprot:Gregarina_sp_Poly_1__8621@NODE_511_length_7822_cov_202_696067_g407_i0_p3_GENE_NODE_511_length_7822_cov_202_696067_g407_i0NODE_511_length_7822_cov_202_696067_g407_i0_p3_ORF_typecomplete_len414_score47_78RecR/PF02132_15/0_006_NODE_511_length_7822_cov_202_696067_g407_i032084449
MKRLLTPPSTASSDGLVVEPLAASNAPLVPSSNARKRIRLSRLSIEGRVDWILDLHVPPGGTVTCVPGSTGGNLRVEELLEQQQSTLEQSLLNNELTTTLSPTAGTSSDESSSSANGCAPLPQVRCGSAASDILQSLTATSATSSAVSTRDGVRAQKPGNASNGDRALIVVSAPPMSHCLQLKTELPSDTGAGEASIACVPELVRPRIALPRPDNRPHVIKTLPIDSRTKLDAGAQRYLATRGLPGVKPTRSASVMEAAPKSRVHFTANGSIPFCRMPNCGRAMYFYKNEDRWRCNLNRGGCGAVFHNVGQDIGPCSKCQRPVADGDPCYDWCVCRYCTSSKRQSIPPIVMPCKLVEASSGIQSVQPQKMDALATSPVHMPRSPSLSDAGETPVCQEELPEHSSEELTSMQPQ